MMISHMQDSESRNVPRYVTSCLTALGAVIKNSSVKFGPQLEQFMGKLIDLILKSDFLTSDNLEVLIKSLQLTHSLITAASYDYCKPY